MAQLSYKVKTFFGEEDLTVKEIGRYPSRIKGNLYDPIFLYSYDNEGCPYAVLTVNVQIPSADDTWTAIDTNNCPWAVEMIEALGIGKATGFYVQSGFCSYPIYSIDKEKLGIA